MELLEQLAKREEEGGKKRVRQREARGAKGNPELQSKTLGGDGRPW